MSNSPAPRGPLGPMEPTKAQRDALRSLLQAAKRATGLSYNRLSDKVSDLLGDGDGPDECYIRWLCNGPPRPLSSPLWAGAIFAALGVSWTDVLRILGGTSPPGSIVFTEGARRLVVSAADVDAHGYAWLRLIIEAWSSRSRRTLTG